MTKRLIAGLALLLASALPVVAQVPVNCLAVLYLDSDAFSRGPWTVAVPAALPSLVMAPYRSM